LLSTTGAAAREVLASAGVAVEVRAEPPRGPLPGEVDTILATMLREAITNVLRHATATRCEITLTVAETAVSLEIANDGVANDGVTGNPADPAPGRTPAPVTGGHGLANLAARAEALRGQLTAHAEGGRFTLTARIPVSIASASDG
jgi:two-component system sensor histidine kinase DesK